MLISHRHFQQIQSSDEWNSKIAGPFFLVIDYMSASSYIDDKYFTSCAEDKDLLKGDFQSYVLVVDANFDNRTTADKSPDGYPGQVRILGNLVWSELFPMVARQSLVLKDLWKEARDHPMKIYTGPTVPSQVAPWKHWNVIKNSMLNGFTKFLAQKNPTLAGKVEGLRKEGAL